MNEYLQAVEQTILDGSYEENRTGIDTITGFSSHYTIDLNQGFPLVTTKKMDTFRWNSLLHEVFWYLSGEHHIRELSNHTSIWDTWADENDNLPTAYGRFWRRFPLPEQSQHLPGEWWVNDPSIAQRAGEFYDISESTVDETVSKWINEEEVEGRTVKTFDQLQHVIDTLNGDNPMRSPRSRRLVITAWHPGNAAISHLPPCHYTYVVNIQDGKLNCHLTQRSADIAVGVPFNIGAYALLTHLIAQETGFEVGEFGHTLVDCHAYCGEGARGEWYNENLTELQEKISTANSSDDYMEIREWILSNAPADESAGDVSESEYGDDHIPGLLEQLSRTPNDRPNLSIDNEADINSLREDDFKLEGYESYEGIRFGVAE